MAASIDTSGSDRQVAKWIWQNLVPKSGQAASVQGELLRAVEKLRWEAQENGNMNWDDGFVSLLSFLEYQVLSFKDLPPEFTQRLLNDVETLKSYVPPPEDDVAATEDDDEISAESLPYTEDDLYDRLEAFVVAFSRAHPELIPHQPNLQLRR
jgi:hypothetical protein